MVPEPQLNASRTVSYPGYIHEILQHAGICYSVVNMDDLAALPQLSILMTVGESALPDALQTTLHEWIAQRGQWIGVGGVCGMTDLFGVIVEKAACASFGGGASNLGEGYLRPSMPHRIVEHLSLPLHFFNGAPVHTAMWNSSTGARSTASKSGFISLKRRS
jgi:hypothetical protein